MDSIFAASIQCKSVAIRNGSQFSNKAFKYGGDYVKFGAREIEEMKKPAAFWAFLILGITIGGIFMVGKVRAQSERVDRSISVGYYYKVKWGYQDEFLELFKKNHYPLLEAQVKAGRLLRVEAFVPRFHGDGRSDWTFMTVLTFKDWQAFGDSSVEAELIKRMYPDQEKYRKEEQRRFELLEAHWDVPLKAAPMK